MRDERGTVNGERLTGNGTINVEGLELRGGGGQRRTKSIVQSLEYREQLPCGVCVNVIIRKQISWLPCGACTCLHVSQVSRG